MICPECKKQGLKSKVYIGNSFTTCMGFSAYYDEAGEYHVHDPNTTSTSYSCSNGHSWGESRKGSCWCGWGKPDKEE